MGKPSLEKGQLICTQVVRNPWSTAQQHIQYASAAGSG